jgi:hypothetical protein
MNIDWLRGIRPEFFAVELDRKFYVVSRSECCECIETALELFPGAKLDIPFEVVTSPKVFDYEPQREEQQWLSICSVSFQNFQKEM